ncbi:Eco57I restriction-modification methylase domain-containing protein [Candidatus Poriferisodalis sp.]|uniref:Eco57I restriction-modification methylase domain-containing protein n=1 Tax=Candidatus Poriferisodalis sp. TaxID=3101277 RepID=UPI003B02A091
MTVCDPTVGSGAFLFAALEVLEPLYLAVLERAEELHRKHEGSESAHCLAQAQQHHSRNYWVLKTLCLNNLYGLDIMDEAVEIAKLRLFLKLAAKIEDRASLEPLPDLDFNIRVGNLLIGIADKADAETRLNSGQLDFGGIFEELATLTNRATIAWRQFAQAQSQDTGTLDHTSHKQRLRAELDAAQQRADELLYALRAATPALSFEDWKLQHKPFHWFTSFPNIWQRGGFDVIIGNPPYMSKSRVPRYARELTGYSTESCPDLYAPCVERASKLLRRSGRISMIVMHSLCFSKRFLGLREHLTSQLSTVWVSSYARAPSELFSGSAAVRNSIVVGAGDSSRALYSSQCRRWTSDFRPSLFDCIEYTRPHKHLLRLGSNAMWPFVDSPVLVSAFAKMLEYNLPLASSATSCPDPSFVYKKVALYQLGISIDPPPMGAAPATQSPGSCHFAHQDERDVAMLALAGRWGYLWWRIFSDEFHVTRGTLLAFPCDVKRICGRSTVGDRAPCDVKLESLLGMATQYNEELLQHLRWTLYRRIWVGRYDTRACQHITDEADLILAQLWGVEDAYEVAGNVRDRSIFGSKE